MRALMQDEAMSDTKRLYENDSHRRGRAVRQAVELADPDLDEANRFAKQPKTFVRVQAAKRLAATGSSAPARHTRRQGDVP